MKQRSTMRYGAMLLGTAIALGIGLSPATANTPDTTTKLAATPSPPVTALPDDEEEAVPVEATPTSAAEIAILSPSANAVLERPATTLTIQYPLNANVEVRINGKLGDRGLIGRTETNKTTQRVTETWYGLTLDQGPNLITVHRIGESKPAASVQIQVSGMPDQIKLKTLETRIPADGRSTATVEGMLLDKDGNLSNWNAMVTLEASAGEFTGADAQPDTPGFQVESNHGKFSAALRSTTQAQQVRVRAQSGTLEAYYQFQFDTLIRPTPLIAGVVDFRLGARGTNFYNRFQDFLPVDRNNSTILDAKGAAFGTASIGEWLITGAYNSDRPLNQDADGNSGLMGVTDTPELQYPVTGDNSTSERVAPSQDSLYLRIERTSPVAHAGTDSFMWGDFTTDEFATTAQEFTAQNRTLHGFKANYNWGGLQLSALYSNTVQGVQRDTIAPDGTSGFYFLSQRPVIDGSEVIMLELQDLRRPGTIVDVQQLVRGVDYTIDYDRGSLLFSQPILRTATAPDGTPLVRTIVATYQYDSGGASTSIMAGRARYHFSRKPGEESWLGGTYWREDQGNRLFELYGVDGTVALGKTGHVTVEYAHSQNSMDKSKRPISGSAYRIEVAKKLFDKVDILGFYRSAEAGFSNNATVSFVPGQTRYGLSVTGAVTPTTNLIASFDHEDNVGVAPAILSDLDQLLNPGAVPTPGAKQDNSLTSVLVGVQQKVGKATLGLNYVHRDYVDRMPDTAMRDVSNQLQATLAMPLRENLSFNALGELNLSGNDPIYSNHVQAGFDWKINPNVSIQLNQHYFWGGQQGDRAITSLDTVSSYNIFKHTQLTGRFSLLGGVEGVTGQGAAGIAHHWQIAPGLGMDVSYEYVLGQFSSQSGTNPEEPADLGDSSASAIGLDSGHNFSVALSYTDNPNFKASGSYQFRTSSSGSNSVLMLDAAGKFTDSLTGLIHYNQAGAANHGLELLGDSTDLSVGLAYRNPKNDRFNALLRYQFRNNPATTPDTILLGSGTGSTDHTLAAEAIYAPDWRWELYGKIGFRNSTSYLANDLISHSSILLGQMRATYRLNYQWDVAAEGRIINTLSTGSNEWGATAEVGYYVTPNIRLAAGYAWGSVSDRDFNNSRSASGPYLDVTVKLDQLFSGFKFLKRPVPPTEGQPTAGLTPSETEPTGGRS